MATNMSSGVVSTVSSNEVATGRRISKKAAAAAALLAATGGGGVAVLEQPGTTIAALPEAAAAKDLGVSEAGLRAVKDAAKSGVNLRDAKTSKAQREAVKQGSLEILLGVGLGAKSQGYGPIVQRVIIITIGQACGIKRVSTADITAANVIKALTTKTVATDLPANLATYIKELEAKTNKDGSAKVVSKDTADTRAKNLKLAQSWVAIGMHKSYVSAIKNVIKLGGSINTPVIHGMMTLPVDRALGMAFGRSITASESVRQTRKLAKA